MKSSTNRLIITIVGTILLPLILYSIYEISSVTEDEAVIEKVYRDQVDAILFSVNQYSNDIVNGLLDKMEDRLTDSLALDPNETYLEYSNFKLLVFEYVDSTRQGIQLAATLLPPLGQGLDWRSINKELHSTAPNLREQLVRYRQNGYRKIEPHSRYDIAGTTYQVIFAALELPNQELVLMTGLIDINRFARDVLAPKLQQIAEDDLIITMGEKGTDNLLYATDSITKEITYNKNMWLFPDFEIGITSNNKTVSELVAERTQYNLTAAFILIALLIFGFTLVVRNLKREIQLTQTKSDFVSNVSHELRTPLSLISMFAETLMLDRVPSWEKRKEYEEIIFKETNRLTNIVNKILNFSQIEANRRVYHPSEIQINSIMDELLHDYKYHLERNGFTYEFWRAEHIPTIWVDKEALYEALVNLVDNAIKYSPDERHLIFRTNHEGKRVYVELEDRGKGIAPDKIKLIFDKFYRISEGNIHATKGAGLGLALVSHIVDAHSGDIEVESTLGKGSIFRLVFYPEHNGKNSGS